MEQNLTNPLKDLQDQLGPIPHSLQLFDLCRIKDAKCQSVLTRLENENMYPGEGELEEESVKRENLISLLQFRLKNPQQAFERNEKILKKYPLNITALVNKVYMTMAMGNEQKATDLLQILQGHWNQEENRLLRATAIAEEADSLSRISPMFYVKSIDRFRDAIKEFPRKYLWKLRCAETCKRCLGITKGIAVTSDGLKGYCNEAISYFREITENGSGRLCARAWAFLGELQCTLQHPNYPLTSEIANEAIDICNVSPLQCFTNALRIDESKMDSVVLERCGAFLRFVKVNPNNKNKLLQERYKILSKAHELRPTSFVCDKLAAILIEMVEEGIEPDGHPITLGSGYKPAVVQSDKDCSLHHEQHDNTQHQTNTKQAKFSQARVSPKKVKMYSPSNSWLSEAVKYLEESIQLTEGCNKEAIYQLGLMYRRFGQLDLAIKKFSTIYIDPDTSHYQRVNAYEQTGFCQLEKSEDETLSLEDRDKERETSKYMMNRAVEEAAELVSLMPTMNKGDLDSWNAYPTLKQLLCSETNKDHTKDIARLCYLIGNHKESLKWYEELRKINPNDIEALHKIIVTHMHLEEFECAQESLNIMLCSSEGQQLLKEHQELFYQVYLGTVKHLMLRNEVEVDKQLLLESCQRIFEFKNGKLNEEEGEPYDVFILDKGEETEIESEHLKDWLANTCGLSVTRNDEDVHPGAFTFGTQVQFITNCKFVIVVLGSHEVSPVMENLITILMGNKSSATIVVVKTGDIEVPSMLLGRRCVQIPQDKEEGYIGRQRFLLQCLMSMLELDYDKFEWLEK